MPADNQKDPLNESLDQEVLVNAMITMARVLAKNPLDFDRAFQKANNKKTNLSACDPNFKKEVYEKITQLKALFLVAHIAAERAELDSSNNSLNLILSIQRALIEEGASVDLAKAITIVYAASFFMGEEEFIPNPKDLQKASSWLCDADIWFNHHLPQIIAEQLTQDLMIRISESDAIAKMEVLKKNLLLGKPIVQADFQNPFQDDCRLALNAVRGCIAETDLNQAFQETPDATVRRAVLAIHKVSVNEQCIAIAAAVLALQTPIWQASQPMDEKKLKDLIDLGLELATAESLKALRARTELIMNAVATRHKQELNIFAHAVIEEVRTIQQEALTSFGKGCMAEYKRVTTALVNEQRAEIEQEFSRVQTGINDYRSNINSAYQQQVQSINSHYDYLLYTNIAAYNAHQEELANAKKHAKNKSKRQIVRSIVGAVVTAIFIPMTGGASISNMPAMLGTIGRGAMSAALNAAITRQNILKDGLQGGLFAGFGAIVGGFLDSVKALEGLTHLKDAMQSAIVGGMQTAINGGNIEKTMLVGGVSSGVASFLVPAPPVSSNQTATGRTVANQAANNTSRSVQSMALHSFVKSTTASTLSGSHIGQTLIAGGLAGVQGLVQGLGQQCGEKLKIFVDNKKQPMPIFDVQNSRVKSTFSAQGKSLPRNERGLSFPTVSGELHQFYTPSADSGTKHTIPKKPRAVETSDEQNLRVDHSPVLTPGFDALRVASNPSGFHFRTESSVGEKFLNFFVSPVQADSLDPIPFKPDFQYLRSPVERINNMLSYKQPGSELGSNGSPILNYFGAAKNQVMKNPAKKNMANLKLADNQILNEQFYIPYKDPLQRSASNQKQFQSLEEQYQGYGQTPTLTWRFDASKLRSNPVYSLQINTFGVVILEKDPSFMISPGHALIYIRDHKGNATYYENTYPGNMRQLSVQQYMEIYGHRNTINKEIYLDQTHHGNTMKYINKQLKVGSYTPYYQCTDFAKGALKAAGTGLELNDMFTVGQLKKLGINKLFIYDLKSSEKQQLQMLLYKTRPYIRRGYI